MALSLNSVMDNIIIVGICLRSGYRGSPGERMSYIQSDVAFPTPVTSR